MFSYAAVPNFCYDCFAISLKLEVCCYGNNVGLMKTMLADEEVVSVFITPSPCGGHVTLAAAVKRCLQCRHDSVRIAVTQCLAIVVNSRLAVDYIIVLLNYDVTG